MNSRAMPISRHSVLVGLSAAAVAPFSVSACTSNGGTGEAGNISTDVPLPDHLPFAGSKPDLAPTDRGVSAGFLEYPSRRESAYSSPPGSGGAVTSVSPIDGPAPIPFDRNTYWQELNRRLNADWKPDVVPGDQYGAKLATVLAGGDIPDLVHLPYREVPRLVDALEHFFEDLTPHLSDDAVRQYPCLANIPSLAWRSAAYNGKIFGVPAARDPVGRVMLVRDDLRQAKNLTGKLETTDDFAELCRGLSDPANNVWALSFPQTAIDFALEAFRVPNGWAEAGGALTSAYETDEMRAALDWISRLWADEVFHPDSFAVAGSAQNSWFYSGRVALRAATPGFWSNAMKNATTPDAVVSAIPPVSGSGEPGRKLLAPGLLGMTSIKKGEQVEELLAVLDWMSSPMGTEEALFSTYGVEGHSFTWSGGEPVLNEDVWSAESNAGAPKLGNHPPVLYVSGHPEITRAQHEYEMATVPNGVLDPTIGLFSDMDIQKGAGLRTNMTAVQFEVIQGRRSLADWDEAVNRWRRDGGDEIRREYEEAFAQSTS